MKKKQFGVFFICLVLMLFQNCSGQFQSDLKQEMASSALPNEQINGGTTVVRPPTNQPPVQPPQVQRRPPANTRTPIVTDPVTPALPPPMIQPQPSSYELGALIGSKLDRFVGRAQIVVASQDSGKAGYFLFILEFKNQIYVLDPDGDKWVLWDKQLKGYITPIMNLASTTGTGLTLIHSLDVTAFGGGILSVGYGVGTDIVAAVEECFATGRLKEVTTIEVQKFMGLVSIPKYDPSSEKTVLVQYFIKPERDDYWLSGYYYVFAISPEGQKLFYTGSAWVNSVTTSSDQWHYSKVDALENLTITQRVPSKDLALYKGWKMFVGYGRSYDDMVTRNLVSVAMTVR